MSYWPEPNYMVPNELQGRLGNVVFPCVQEEVELVNVQLVSAKLRMSTLCLSIVLRIREESGDVPIILLFSKRANYFLNSSPGLY